MSEEKWKQQGVGSYYLGAKVREWRWGKQSETERQEKSPESSKVEGLTEKRSIPTVRAYEPAEKTSQEEANIPEEACTLEGAPAPQEAA